MTIITLLVKLMQKKQEFPILITPSILIKLTQKKKNLPLMMIPTAK